MNNKKITDAEHLRQWAKFSQMTNRYIADAVGKSPSWVGLILRGHYPLHGYGGVPKHIWDWALSRGMPDNATTTYVVEGHTAFETKNFPCDTIAAAKVKYDELEKDETTPRGYLFAVTGSNRRILRSFDHDYDEFLAAHDSRDPYVCVHCGNRSRVDETGGYCFAAPYGIHHFEYVEGDE